MQFVLEKSELFHFSCVHQMLTQRIRFKDALIKSIKSTQFLEI
jgi:hypothetical protein